MQKQKGISTLIGIIIVIVAAVIAVGGFLTYTYYSNQSKEEESLTYELSKVSQVKELPNNIPIFPNAVSHSYSSDSFNFISKGSPANVLKYYVDYFSKNSQYKIAQKQWCANPQAMFCTSTAHTITVSDVSGEQGVDIVVIDVIEYKTGSSFTLTFPTNK